MTHESKESYIIDAITKNQPKAKDIKTEIKPNWDMKLLFKVGRKKESIELTNLDYERYIAKKKKPFVEDMQTYFKELDEATKQVRETHKDMLEQYQEMLSRETEDFARKEIDKYFNLEKDLKLTK